MESIERLVKLGSYLHILLFLNSKISSKISIYYQIDRLQVKIRVIETFFDEAGRRQELGVDSIFLLRNLPTEDKYISFFANEIKDKLLVNNPGITPVENFPLLVSQLHQEGLEDLKRSLETNPDCFLEVSVKPDNRIKKIIIP